MGTDTNDTSLQVIVFAFDMFANYVVLLKKRPGSKSLSGLWNGVGGSVKQGETPLEAAQRETQEESGIFLPDYRIKTWPEPWPEASHILAYFGRSPTTPYFWQKEDEAVGLFPVRTVTSGALELAPNVQHAVPLMAEELRKDAFHAD